MYLTNSRITHALSVARKMEDLVLENDSSNTNLGKEMFTLGLLHNIGWEFQSATETTYGKLGGDLMKDVGYKYWQEIYHQLDPNSSYTSEALSLLNRACLMIGGYGQDIDVGEKLKEAEKLYGESSEVRQRLYLIAKQLEMTE